MKMVNRILDSMISDIDKVKLGLYEASTKRKKQKLFQCAMYDICLVAESAKISQ